MAARLIGAVLVTVVLCSAAAAAEKRPPSVELMEFLADFETVGGNAVDVLQFTVTAKETTKRACRPKKQQGRPAPVGSKGDKP